MDKPLQGATEAIPEVPPQAPVDSKARKEQQGDFGGGRMDVGIRRIAAYGSLAVALSLYVVGLCVVLHQMGMWPFHCEDMTEVSVETIKVMACSLHLSSAREGWHSFVAAMVALFSVPTVLVIGVLRSVTSRKDPDADSAYAMIGERLVAAIEKFAGSKN